MMKVYKKAIPLALALAIGLSPASVFAQSSHTVKSGDTLWGLSSKYNVSIDQIKNWNNLNNNLLYVGQKIVLNPSNSGSSNGSNNSSSLTYTVENGDTLWSIANKNNVSISDLKNWNGLRSDSIYVGQKLKFNGNQSNSSNNNNSSNSTSTSTYVVQKGDTLYSIAKKYKVSVADVKRWNNLNDTVISTGQKLSINGKTNNSSSNNSSNSTTVNKVGIVNINSGTLNVRSEASTSSSVVGQLKKGESVNVLSEKNGWVNIQFEQSKKGWVSKDFLTIKEVATDKSDTVQMDSAEYKVIATQLNVRSGAGTNFSTIDFLPNGKVVNVQKVQDGWAYISYNGKNGWVSADYLTKVIKNQSKGQAIVIDAGHGGSDPGAIAYDGTKEEDINLAISMRTKEQLENRGYKVIMVRTGDYECNKFATSVSAELKCRIDLSKINNAEVFVSIHNNTGPSSARGTETYYSSNNVRGADSKKLAESVHRHYQTNFGSLDRKVVNSNLYVNRYNSVPSILLEVGFLSNTSDLAKLKSSVYQQKVAMGIAEGIDEYFSR